VIGVADSAREAAAMAENRCFRSAAG